MIDVLIDSLLDLVKLLPFLFIAFLIIELLEDSINEKSMKLITKSQKVGPLFGGVLGLIPSCGFSVMATNLYVSRIISLGTLIAVYLATSDEMLPILIANKADITLIVLILSIKLVIAMMAGFIIDLLTRKQENQKLDFNICDSEHCDCESKGPMLAALKHTATSAIYILLINLVINILFYVVGQDNLMNMFANQSFLSVFIMSIFGLVPNCATSIIICELYLSNMLNIGSMIAGLLANSGLALVVLFKSNKNHYQNWLILVILVSISILSGLLINLLSYLL